MPRRILLLVYLPSEQATIDLAVPPETRATRVSKKFMDSSGKNQADLLIDEFILIQSRRGDAGVGMPFSSWKNTGQFFRGKTVQIALSDIPAKLQYATFDFEFIISAPTLETLLAPWDLYRTTRLVNAHPHPSLDSNQ